MECRELRTYHHLSVVHAARRVARRALLAGPDLPLVLVVLATRRDLPVRAAIGGAADVAVLVPRVELDFPVPPAVAVLRAESGRVGARSGRDLEVGPGRGVPRGVDAAESSKQNSGFH